MGPRPSASVGTSVTARKMSKAGLPSAPRWTGSAELNPQRDLAGPRRGANRRSPGRGPFPRSSNRSRVSRLTEPSAPLVGLDRVSLSFPVLRFDHDQRSWSNVNVQKAGMPSEHCLWGTTERVKGASVFLGVSEHKGTGRVTGKLEVNAARLVDPAGWALVPAGPATDALRALRPTVEHLMTPSAKLDDWRVRRGDVARDFFGITGPNDIIRALGPLPRPYSRRRLVYSDPSGCGAETLSVGSNAGVVLLYDKCRESGGKAPEGTVRWEAQCRGGWLVKYGGIQALSDLDEESCLRLAEDRWAWSAMGTEVGSVAPAYEVLEAAGMSWRQFSGFWAWLCAQAAGRRPVLSKETLARYRRRQRELNVAVDGGEVKVQNGALMRRLDWQSGREVYRAVQIS